MTSGNLKGILFNKCDRVFFPARARRARNILSYILNCENLYIDVNCRDFYIAPTEDTGEKIGPLNFIEYLCAVTDKNNNYSSLGEDHSRLTKELKKRGAVDELFF